MALFGLVSYKEHQKLQQELETLKAQFLPYEHWQLETARAEEFNLPDLSLYWNQANLYRRVSSLFLAIDLTASAGALTPFSVARLVAGKEPKDIPSHPFEILLSKPNPIDSRYEFLYATIAFWKLNRNAYWWLNRPDEYTPPEEIWFIPPHMIQPVPDDQMYLRGYLYEPGTGAQIFLPPHEIVHFKGFNPFSRFVGLSAALESLAVIAQGYLGMTDWQTKLYKQNNARLPGVLSFKQMIADPQWEKIKADTREASKNREMLMLRGVGDKVDWQQSTASQKDMEFIATLDMIDKKIMDTIAPGSYTMLSENATEANSRTGRATFNELTVYPMHVMMAEKITNGILGSYPGRPLIGRFEDIRITDKQMELAEQDKYAATHTIAEIREEYYGDEPLGDDRDKLLPSQINAQSGDIQKPEPPKQPFGGSLNNNNQPEMQLEQATNEPPEQPEESEQAQKSTRMLEALQKYERYALRKIGKVMAFANDQLPQKLIAEIAGELENCRNEGAVKAVFAGYKSTYAVKVEAVNNDKALVLVMEGLRKAISAL